MAEPHAPFVTVASISYPVGDGTAGSKPMPVTASVVISPSPIEIVIGGVDVPVGDGTGGSSPLPITGSISATNPSVGVNGAAAPADSTQIGFTVGGLLEPVSAANPLPVSGSFTPPALQNVNLTEVGGNALTTTVPVSGTVKIDQTTPGSTNAVDATNFPVTVDTNAGAAGASTPRVVIATGGATPLPTGAATAALQTTINTTLGTPFQAGGSIGNTAFPITARANKGDAALTITSSTAETTLIAATAGVKHDLYGLIIANISATACEVDFRDTTGGAVRFSFEIPPNETRGFMLASSDGYDQVTANTNWTAQCVTSVASIKISALYVNN
jgi:hypothetical protein